ncbi:MAG: transcription antiterminator BglG [Clostridiales bacterium]|jgi:beta-glucoside operon transcriptional antiterminator|nr:transcription antiterminator BglG [Clostridiales bacterium]
MEIVKIINNNIISSYDEKGRELVVMGKGLGFQAKPGQIIDESKIDKIFRMDSNADTRRLQDLLMDIPLEHIKLGHEIIEDTKLIIDRNLNRNIYITLIDHINFAIERFHQNILFTNPLLREIKSFYPKEYEAGVLAVDKINSACGLMLNEDEAASIAMHIVNAELGTNIPNVIDITKIVQYVLKIVKAYFAIEFYEDSLSYERFLTHLKFFALRIVTKVKLDDDDLELHDIIKTNYSNEYICAEQIRKYIEVKFNLVIPTEEMTYLTVQIRRLMNKK